MQHEQFDHPDRPLLEQTDAEVFLALKAGQTAALSVLYDRHVGLVYGVALKVLEDAQEAEDLAQDIFLNLGKSSYDPQRGVLRTFLAVLVRSRAIDRLRSRSTTQKMLDRWQLNRSQMVASNSPAEYVSQQEQSQEVQAALAQLSESQQQVLRLSYYDGLSHSEIAEQLQMPLGTVKSTARRGLLKLRQTLTDYIE
ncbi:MAG: sigma-70 family RNA polymerase sigma factor [Cyanobacteria bacterium RM1_2_2]|nr:sigma-70 family RNA polymerase sigma factor [Cyanobacteria bacterium RM1_2_2]